MGKKTKVNSGRTLVGVGVPGCDGIPVRFLDHQTGDSFTVFVTGLDTGDVDDGVKQVIDESLAQQALDAVKDITDTWLDFKARLIDDAIFQRREERRRRAGTKRTSELALNLPTSSKAPVPSKEPDGPQ